MASPSRSVNPVHAGLKSDTQSRVEIGQARRARTRTRILAAAFDLYGRENGLFSRVEEICHAAGVTRQTFYNHFASMDDLRDALTYEVTHDFMVTVTHAIQALPNAAERTAAAIRFYMGKAWNEPKWGWSMVNISASGIIFGLETYRQAEQTVKDGMAQRVFSISDARLGRDLILGTTLGAIVTQLREAPGPTFACEVTRQILIGLGVAAAEATAMSHQQLPPLSPQT